MSDLIIKDVDDNLIHKLKEQVQSHGVPIEEEVKNLLNHALVQDKIYRENEDDLLILANTIREKNAHRQKTDSTNLIREDRVL